MNEERENDSSASVCSAWEFDRLSKQTGTVEIREGDKGILELWIEDECLISACRYQWGVWLTIGKMGVAQGDETRSALQGLIAALTVFREMVETTEDATILKQNNQDREPTE